MFSSHDRLFAANFVNGSVSEFSYINEMTTDKLARLFSDVLFRPNLVAEGVGRVLTNTGPSRVLVIFLLRPLDVNTDPHTLLVRCPQVLKTLLEASTDAWSQLEDLVRIVLFECFILWLTVSDLHACVSTLR